VADIERQARYLAKENRNADPDITDIYWFPDESEVRLVEVLAVIPVSGDETLQPFYFRPSPEDNLPAPSGVVIVRPDEVGRANPPEDWGDWNTAVKLSKE
jgi:hypothetical protein